MDGAQTDGLPSWVVLEGELLCRMDAVGERATEVSLKDLALSTGLREEDIKSLLAELYKSGFFYLLEEKPGGGILFVPMLPSSDF